MFNFRYLKSVIIIFFLLHTLKAGAPDDKFAYIIMSEHIDAYDRLIKAVVQVESFGDTLANNTLEEAIGAFQIRPIRLLDYNRRTGNQYKMEDCYNYNISKKIFLYYAHEIGFPKYEKIAKNWNGSGDTTLEYWEKVKSYL
jgi:hypothetical protein